MRFLDSWLIRGGLLLLVLGVGPLLAIMIGTALGLTNDPDPNPIGPGMLAGVSFYPSLAMIVFGVVKVNRANRNTQQSCKS